MSDLIAALPMYDWPERRDEVDRQWAELRDRLRGVGVDAPEALVRRNADMPAVPGGIRDAKGMVIAPDPASLPGDALDFPTLWMHPQLLFAQTCWGPLERGLATNVQIIGQPDYSAVEGGEEGLYSSAIVMRRGGVPDLAAPADGGAALPIERMRGLRFTFNSHDSMSGFMSISRDLEVYGETLALFGEQIQSGGHRNSIVEIALGRADVAAIDCLSWELAKRYEPAARQLAAVGWTARRKGLPFIASRHISSQIIQSVVTESGWNSGRQRELSRAV